MRSLCWRERGTLPTGETEQSPRRRFFSAPSFGLRVRRGDRCLGLGRDSQRPAGAAARADRPRLALGGRGGSGGLSARRYCGRGAGLGRPAHAHAPRRSRPACGGRATRRCPLRPHLGDLAAGRAGSESEGIRPVQSSRHGALTLRRYERPASLVSFDFVAQWSRATVSRIAPGGQVAMCSRVPDHFECADAPAQSVKAELLRSTPARTWPWPLRSLATPPQSSNSTVFPWGASWRSGLGCTTCGCASRAREPSACACWCGGASWGAYRPEPDRLTLRRFDTSTLAGQSESVRFEITTDDPGARYLGFAAEARS